MNLKLQIVINFLSKFSTQLNVFILSIILVRFLDKYSYGTYLQCQLIINMTLYMSTLGLPHSVYYFWPKALNRREYLLTTFAVMTLTGAAAGLLLYTGDSIIARLFNNEQLPEFMFYTSIAVFCLLPFELFEPFLVTIGKNNLYASVNAVISILFFLSVFLPLKLSLGLKTVFIALSTLYICQFIILVYILSHYSKNSITTVGLKRIHFKDVFRFSSPLSLSVFIGVASREVDRYIISTNFLPQEYAVYSRGAIKIPFIELMPYSVNNLLLSRYTDYYDSGMLEKAVELWKKSVAQIALIVYPCFAFCWVFSTEMITILYTEKYRDSVPVFKIYLFALIAKLAVFDSLIRVSGQTRYLSFLAAADLATNVILSLVLLGFMGVRGPAIATIVVLYASTLVQLLIIKRLYSTTFLNVFPWKLLCKTMIISVLGVLPLFFIKPFLGAITVVKLGFLLPCYIIIFVGLSVISGLVGVDEIKKMLQLFSYKR